jgi:hypothetical protein
VHTIFNGDDDDGWWCSLMHVRNGRENAIFANEFGTVLLEM